MDDVIYKFCEENYLTKQEAQRTLNSPIIDIFWNKVLTYRNERKRTVTLSNLLNQPFSYCETESLTSKVFSIGNKINEIVSKSDDLVTNEIFQVFKEKSLICSYELYAKANNIVANKIVLRSLIKHSDSPLLSNDLLTSYSNAFNFVYENDYTLVDKNYILNFFGFFNEIKQYRLSEISNKYAVDIFNREYTSCPKNLIENEMSKLLNFIDGQNVPFVLKTIISIYDFLAIKPFSKHNLDISVLLLRTFFKNEFGPITLFIPFEKVFDLNLDKIDELIKTCYKNNDLTYFILKYCDLIDDSLNLFKDLIIQSQGAKVEEEFVYGDKEEIEQEYTKETLKEVRKSNNYLSNENSKFKEYETELMESDPRLSKKQIHFYVRHCTVGKFYTIQMFKTFEGCVYETARTSMDTLADCGYYRKESIKNKFVYTPVDK